VAAVSISATIALLIFVRAFEALQSAWVYRFKHPLSFTTSFVEARGFLARAAAGISMSAGLFMVRSFVCYANHPNAPMLQECRLIGSVRLEAMIAIALYGRTTRPRPQRAIAMTVRFVVTIPTA
jgi:hypothetical protein